MYYVSYHANSENNQKINLNAIKNIKIKAFLNKDIYLMYKRT